MSKYNNSIDANKNEVDRKKITQLVAQFEVKATRCL